jgi:hypothetical protein
MSHHFTIDHITPDQFDTFRWWEPQRFRKDPRWFYGTIQGNKRGANTARPDTLDDALQPLVRFLTIVGLPTLPSCSGHFPTEDDLRSLHRGLEHDGNLIRSIGLTLRCTENDEMIVFRDPFWVVPPYEDWVVEVRKYRGVGRIGILFKTCDPSLPAVQQALRYMSGVKLYTMIDGDNTVLTILTRTMNETVRDQLWALIARRVRSAIDD